MSLDDSDSELSRNPKWRFANQSLLGYSGVWFTDHADRRMRQRGVRDTQVFDAVANPSRRGLPTQPRRKRVRKLLGGGRVLDVVYEEWNAENQLVIVTVLRLSLPKKRRR